MFRSMQTISCVSFMSFFMVAFFVLHGYCSHTKRTFKESFEYGCKTLIIPCFFLNLWHYHWFAVTMFGCILIDSLLKEEKDRKKYLIYTILFFLGIVAHGRGDNFFFISYILVYSSFIFLGQKFRFIVNNNKFGFLSIVIFIIIWLLHRYKYNTIIPFITGGSFKVTLSNFYVFIIASICGSSAIFLISRGLERFSGLTGKLFAKLGKQSLVIYLFHFTIISIIETQCVTFLNRADTIESIIAFFGIFFVSLFGSYYVGIVIEKHFPWMIGRNKFVM